MESVQGQHPLAERRWPSTQIFFAICALGWFPFVMSSFNYQNESWFPWLLSGRVLVAAIAVFAGVLTFFVPRIAKHSELAYSLLCVSLQASFGILESRTSIEFYNFISVFVLMVAVFTRLNFRSWLKFGFAPTLIIAAVPLLFKDAHYLSSMAVLVDSFSPVIASLVIGLLIGRTTCIKNEVLAHNKKLQDDLTRERDQQKEIIQQQLKELSAAKVSAAIAQAAQMVAHDVRKPFSMLRMTLDSLLRAKSASDIDRIAKSSFQVVSDALAHADALIRNVLYISTKSSYKLVAVSVEDVLQRVVSEFRSAHAGVSVSVSLNHNRKISGSEDELKRVFANIIANAAEAMQGTGRIEVSSKTIASSNGNSVRFSIWNSGTAIDPLDAETIFEPFFTKGKSGGTGLGLAIAAKVVGEHNGKIWCEPAARGGVAFHFEIPEASSADLLKVEKQESEADVEAALRTAIAQWNGYMNVLILDDEKLYRDAILMLLSDEFYSAKLRIHTATNAQEALETVGAQRIDLAFLDIDLGRDAATGLDVLAKMRASGERAFCCVHSNRVLEAQADFEQRHGADAVVPKPITRIQLMRILMNAGSRFVEKASRGLEKEMSDKRYAFVDDCEGTRVIWESDWPEGKLMTFSSPEEFWKHSEINPEFLNGISAVFTDFRFDDASVTTGSDFATALKNRFSGPVFLTTDALLTLERGHAASENCRYKVLSKEVPSREFLRGLSH